MTVSRKILKTFPNGYEIPYPDELIHNELFFLKDYRLARFPGKESGRPSDISYEDYVEWLNAYLTTCDIALTEEQERIRDYLTADTDRVGPQPVYTNFFKLGFSNFYILTFPRYGVNVYLHTI